MKKLIALAVVFGLVAGGLFAADLNVNMATSYNLLVGDNAKIITEKSADAAQKKLNELNDTYGPTASANPAFRAQYPQLPGETATEYATRMADTYKSLWHDKLEEGAKNIKHSGNKESLYRISTSAGDDKFGGWFRAQAGARGGNFAASGFVWWQPLDILKVYMGNNPDGSFGRDGVAAGWAFYKGAGDGGMVQQGNAWGGGYWDGQYAGSNMRNAFFGGTDIEGIALEIPLNSMLNFMVNVPVFRHPGSHANYTTDEYNEVFQDIRLQGQVNLDFGNICLTYTGEEGSGVIDPEAKRKFANMGKFYVDASIGAIDGLGLNVGVGYPLPATYKKRVDQQDISVGVSADYTLSDTFGIKTRMLGKFGGQSKNYWGKVQSKTAGFFGMDIMPYLSLTDTMTLYVSLGFGAAGKEQEAKLNDIGYSNGNFKPVKDSDKFGWHFNPYISIGEGCGVFYAGFRMWCDNASKSGKTNKTPLKETEYNLVKFEVPVGITISL